MALGPHDTACLTLCRCVFFCSKTISSATCPEAGLLRAVCESAQEYYRKHQSISRLRIWESLLAEDAASGSTPQNSLCVPESNTRPDLATKRVALAHGLYRAEGEVIVAARVIEWQPRDDRRTSPGATLGKLPCLVLFFICPLPAAPEGARRRSRQAPRRGARVALGRRGTWEHLPHP